MPKASCANKSPGPRDAYDERTALWSKWTKEEIIERAGKFKQVTEWVKKDRASYAAARRMKLLDDPDVVGHFQKGKVINRKWTREKVLESALKCSCRSEWRKKFPQAYKAARSIGIFEQATEYMEKPYSVTENTINVQTGRPKLRWTKNENLL